MTTSFRYQARSASGRVERGALDAQSRAEALKRLRQRNLTPLELKEGPANDRAANLSDAAARDLARALAQLLRAGLPFAQALRFASEELAPYPAQVAARMREAAERGEPASTALSEFSGAPARLLRGVIAAGEASGRLAEALERAAHAFERSATLRARAGTALIYPGFVVIATIATLLCFLLFVVPTLGQAFEGAEERIPASTRALLAFSAWLKADGGLAALAASVIIAAAGSSASVRKQASLLIDAVLASPVGLGIAQRLDFATFASLAALALKAGVPAASAFASAAGAARNGRVRNQLERAIADIRVGERPSLAFERTARPPKSFLRLTHVGEETGKLGDALDQASALLSSEAEQRLERLGAIAGPIITLALGALVAGVVMSLFLGLLAMSDLVTA